MGFLTKFIARVILNGIALYIATIYFPGFMLGGVTALAVGALILAFLHAFIGPILRLVTAPLRWITFGLFNIVINMAILWFADQLLTQLTIADFSTLFWVSIIVAIGNAFL